MYHRLGAFLLVALLAPSGVGADAKLTTAWKGPRRHQAKLQQGSRGVYEQ